MATGLNLHNIATDSDTRPAPHRATATDLARTIEALGHLAPDLHTAAPTHQMRLAQYRHAQELTQWATETAGHLADGLAVEHQ